MATRAKRNIKLLLSELKPSRLKELFRAFNYFCDPVANLLMYTGLKPLENSKYIELKNGFRIKIDSIHDLISIWGCWVRQDYPVTGHEKVIIDAGANIGAFSTFALSKCPATTRIFALEPVRETFQVLVANLTANLFDRQITALDYGIAAQGGERTISLSKFSPYSSLYFKACENTEIIKVHSLAEVLTDIGDPEQVDLLKMDCEGAEMEAILGAEIHTLKRFKRIVMEYHLFSGFSIAEMTSHLSNAGLREVKNEFHPRYNMGFAEYAKLQNI